MIWSTEYLNNLTARAEIEIAKELFGSIIERYSLPVQSGVSEYKLPDYISNIRKVLYKGERLDPIGFDAIDGWIHTFEGSTFGPFEKPTYDSYVFDADSIISSTPQAKPQRYFYNKMGENVIRFNPTPNETIVSYNNLYSTNVPNAVIIEYEHDADGVNYKIPIYIRKRTIKHFVLWKAFLKEGNGQNLKASQYHQARYLIQLERAKLIMGRIYSSIIHTKSEITPFYDRNLPARPVLPPTYGIIVENMDDDY